MARSSYCVLVHALLASEVLLAAAIQTDGHVQKIEQLPSLTDTVPKHIVLVKPGGTEMKSLLLLTVFGSAYGLLTFFLLVALCVGGCLRQQDEEGTPTDRFWLPRFVATGGNLGSVSQIVYRGWVLVCYTLPSCLVFGIPVVMIILLIDHVEEVAMYIFVLTSVSGLCIVLNLAITGAIGLCRLQFALSVPPERSEEQPECSPEQPKVIHWVVLPQYKESVEIVSQTLESLCRSSLSQQMGVLLAMEARESEAAEKASALAEAFSGKFGDLQVCYHPDDLPQDPPGKASNCAFAFHWLLLYLELDLKDGRSAGGDDGTELRRRRAEEQLEMLPLNAPRLGAEAAASVMLTVGDADSVFHHFYFEELTRQFSASPTKQHIWQSPILHVKNFESSPAPVKVGTLLTSMNELAVHADPNSVAFPYSTYSLPLELARDVGGWDPEWISEDWHMGIKCMLMTFGQCTLKKHPLPICNYTPEDVTYFGTIRARWVQMRRHAMGFGDLSYIFMILPLLQVATRSPGCSSRAFFSTVSKAFPLLLRITSVHVTLGLLTVFGVIMAVLSVLELTDFIAAGRIDRIITLGREFQALLLGAVVFCGAVSACHFARAYQLVMRKLERQRTDAFVDWCRFCFYLLWAGPFFFLAAGLCSCLAAIQMLRGNMDYVVAPKPRPRPLTEEYEVCREAD